MWREPVTLGGRNDYGIGLRGGVEHALELSSVAGFSGASAEVPDFSLVLWASHSFYWISVVQWKLFVFVPNRGAFLAHFFLETQGLWRLRGGEVHAKIPWLNSPSFYGCPLANWKKSTRLIKRKHGGGSSGLIRAISEPRLTLPRKPIP